MPKYVLLIYDDERRGGAMNPAEASAIMEEYWAFSDEVREITEASEPLHPTSEAVTVRLRGGERTVTDGPFAETKEQLGAFYLVEARDRDEAVDIAARIPGARTGSIEVRPVFPIPPRQTGRTEGGAS
jgi:hypothetical protein